MDEITLINEFLTQNAEKIYNLGKQTIGSANEAVRIKLRLAYEGYLTTTRQKYSRSKSFFIRHEPVDLYTYYVPTAISCGSMNLTTPDFSSCLQLSNRIVISGSGGSGKSVLMRHLFLDCIRDKRYVPVLIELRDLNSENADVSLDEVIVSTLDAFGFDTSGDYIKRAKDSGHFAFFLDGYDEVNPTIKKRIIQQILTLSKKFSACPIILSTRPDDIINGIEDFSIFQMMPLDLNSAIRLVEKLPFDPEVKIKFSKNLGEGLFEKHESFLSNPLLLSIMLLTYGENAEIPGKLSIFYNQAYEALFQRHDANKGGFSRERLTSLDIQDFARIFALFSLQTYDRRIFKMSRTQCLQFIEKSRDSLKYNYKAEEYLGDLLSAACLLVEDGLEIAYSHRSFQEYFVALHISLAPPSVQEKLINRYWPHMRSDNVIALLLELNPDLVERVLFVPVLEKFFNEIGAKRKIGITHLTRYLQMSYDALQLRDNGLSASVSNKKADFSSVIRMAVGHVGLFRQPSGTVHAEHFNKNLKKFHINEHRTILKLKDLNYRSPIISEISKSHGIFSLKYLQSGFDAYNFFKSKHATVIQSLDALLSTR